SALDVKCRLLAHCLIASKAVQFNRGSNSPFWPRIWRKERRTPGFRDVKEVPRLAGQLTHFKELTMIKQLLLLSIAALVAEPFFTCTAAAHEREEHPKIGFLPAVVDPFYQVMEIGVNQTVEDFGL